MGSIRTICFILLLMGIVSTFTVTTCAGPPFLTDDPEPVPFKHWEFYLFSTVDARPNSTSGTGPAFEFNVGALPNLQVHLVLPLAFTIPKGESSAYGLGDMEFGLKFRFIQETDYRPMVGVFPLLEIPTGDADRGLGNRRAWGKLPVWLQKSWGPWTTYGGGGYAINPAPEQRHYFFGGWLLQRDLGEKLTLGGRYSPRGGAATTPVPSRCSTWGASLKSPRISTCSLRAATPLPAAAIRSATWAFTGPGDSAKGRECTRDRNL
jgi:hypothetical protein